MGRRRRSGAARGRATRSSRPLPARRCRRGAAGRLAGNGGRRTPASGPQALRRPAGRRHRSRGRRSRVGGTGGRRSPPSERPVRAPAGVTVRALAADLAGGRTLCGEQPPRAAPGGAGRRGPPYGGRGRLGRPRSRRNGSSRRSPAQDRGRALLCSSVPARGQARRRGSSSATGASVLSKGRSAGAARPWAPPNPRTPAATTWNSRREGGSYGFIRK